MKGDIVCVQVIFHVLHIKTVTHIKRTSKHESYIKGQLKRILIRMLAKEETCIETVSIFKMSQFCCDFLTLT